MAAAGSIANSLYGSKLSGDATAGLPAPAADAAGESVGAAAAVSGQLPRAAGDSLMSAAGTAFTDATGIAMLVGAGVVFTGAILVRRHLPDIRQKEPADVVELRPDAEAAVA